MSAATTPGDDVATRWNQVAGEVVRKTGASVVGTDPVDAWADSPSAPSRT